MLETNTVVAVAIFCILSIFLAILRPRILRNSARIAEYLGKVDPGQEAIPVDEKCWYYSTLKRQNISTKQELDAWLEGNRRSARTLDSGLKVACYSLLAFWCILNVIFVVFLIVFPEEVNMVVPLFMLACMVFLAYLLLKTFLDNSKAIEHVIEDYLKGTG